MTKRELVIEVAERLGYTQNEVADVVQAALEAVTQSLAEGERLEIRNFGVFEVKTRDARMGRNPRTGQEVPITQKRVATFKPGKALKELVQTGNLEAYDAELARHPNGPESYGADGPAKVVAQTVLRTPEEERQPSSM